MPKSGFRLKDVACLIRIAEENPDAAKRQAIALAAQHEAHLTAILGVHTFTAPYTPFWTSMSASIAADVNQKTRQRAESFAESFRQEAAAAGVSLDIELASGAFVDVATKAALIARAADLVVVDQPHGAFDTTEVLLEEALFRSGRPVMVATPKRPPVADLSRIVIGWDGSSHAVRAVSDALALFPSIRAAEIVSVSGEKDLSGMLPAADFARHLARKGVEVTLSDVPRGGRSVGSVLDGFAKQKQADALVMGAFGHSRWREFLLGGVTVELTSSAETPLFLAY